jgi:hypothetical protein
MEQEISYIGQKVDILSDGVKETGVRSCKTKSWFWCHFFNLQLSQPWHIL